MKKAGQLVLFSFVFIFLLSECSSHPKITLEKIQNDIVGKSTSGWYCEKDEPREISILESKYKGDKATIIYIKTQTAPRRFMREQAAGKVRLHYEWIPKEWVLVQVENLTFK